MTEKPKAESKLNARVTSLIVLVLAIIVSSYLGYLKVSNREAVCIEAAVFDCGTVLSSVYSEIRGIPIAWLGLGANLVMTALLLLEYRLNFLRRYGVALVFAVSLFTFLFSIYLIYIQAFRIQAYCPWCLSHEAFMTLLFGLSVWRISKWDLEAE